MTDSTQASIETTANFILAVEDYLNNLPQHNPVISRLLYTEDGAILGVSEDQPPQGYLWQQIDRKKFEQEYGYGPYVWLKMQEGKIINTRPESNARHQMQLVPGSKWQADKMFRLILDSGDTDGWQKRTTN